ncbi:Ig-like domain-containing protein [Pseudoponticoccus marisrubri]|uniref:Ig-like domain (Group 3) n=1 Tax=Pseudoponticoccus marisrubri TaxID=1685382 RepID=A0A0W7WPK0_9RHOB|nr:Ig-like domain-containing protein [Pseudoponticoccus marisrubri]KUF12476.1 hypothetical protein AVJ23_01735 [Pseudoponticoccus marisrubri]
MNAIDFVIRTRAGTVQHGSVGGPDESFLIPAGAGNDISLNIRQLDLRGYDRAGDDLLITLADGRVVVLEGYFGPDGADANRLFLSSDGILNEVSFVDPSAGALFAQYGPTETWGKWSPSDDLIFVQEPTVVAEMPYTGEEEEVSMLATGLLGAAPGLLGAAGLGAAGLGAAALLGGGGDGNGGGSTWNPPTVDNPDDNVQVGGDDPSVTVTGTANPDSEVEVVIGDETVTGTADEDGTWEVVFEGDTFPDDGTYDDIDVTVTDPDGTETELDGPSYEIDTTPPVVETTDGTVSQGDVFNAEDHTDGVTIVGVTEPGATVTVTIDEHSQTDTAGEDGSWSFTFDDTVLPGGEYTQDVTISATDDFGNTGTITDAVEIDTVPNPISIDPVTSDDLVNGDDADAGFQITGSSAPGAVVTVVFEDLTREVVTGADGNWSVDVTSGDFSGGEYDTTVTASTVDAAGNPSATQSAIRIDTVNEVALTNTPLTGDDVIGGDEIDAGVTFTGTSQPGATVEVVVDGTSRSATTAEDGSWSVTFEGGTLTGGTRDVTASVTSTDGAGNASALTHDFTIDTETSVTIDTDTVGGDGIINATERDGSVSLTGTAEPGASVTVTVAGATLDTTAETDGSWSVTLPAGTLPEGETTVTVSAVATDAYGNTASTSGEIPVDTVTGVTLDDMGSVINAADRADGLALTGTGEPGAAISVAVAGQVLSTTVSGDGSWSVALPAADIPEGETSLDVEVTATDAAGNTAGTTGSVDIDTVTSVTLDETGSVINAADRADGLALTGTGEPGAAISVAVAGQVLSTTVSGDGSWSVALPAADIPEGETSLDVEVTATDAAGNTAGTTGNVDIDTVTGVTVDTASVAGDGVVNAAEQAGSVTLTGTAEAGAAISVAVAGETLTTTAGTDGAWSVAIPAGRLPEGETSAEAVVTATDAAGNVATTSGSIAIDTLNAITLKDDTVEGDGTVNAAERADGVVLTGEGNPGAAVEVTVAGTTLSATVSDSGTWQVTIPAGTVPEGERSLSVTATSTDAAGNLATATGTIAIDTLTSVSVDTDDVEGDGVVNAVEHADGVTLTGAAEPGATVEVTLGALTRSASVASDGSWSADFAAFDIPEGERVLDVTATATDAAGNTATATGTLDVDTLVRDFAVTATPGGADAVVNAEEAAAGLTLTGTTEPGGTVTLDLDGEQVEALVAADGSWTASFAPAQLPDGERTVTLTATATDPAGNTDTITQDVRFDTDAGMLTISPEPVEGDDMVNAAEASDGVILRGTSNPGQMVDVTMNGVTHTVETAANGIWTAPFAAGELAAGTYTADITATITDSAGNTLTRTDTLNFDTEVLNFATSTDPVEGDNIINADEASDGFTLSGTTEPGGSVAVTFAGQTIAAGVDPEGNWSVDFPASAIAAGEYPTEAQVTTTDAAGNTADATVSFAVDTEVNRLAMSADPVTADDVVNAIEALQGISLTGVVEPGSEVVVTVGGVAHVASVEADGSWSADIPPESIPEGTLEAPVQVDATDAAGNTRSISDTISIDTDVPDSPDVESYTRDHTGLRGISIETTDDAVAIGHVVSDAEIDPVGNSAVEIPVLNETSFAFTEVVPDGSHLVVSGTDAAGNTSGTYLVVDDTRTSEVAMTDELAGSLSAFQVETIDLQFAEDSHLTITEDQILALSQTSDTLVVEGGSDDSVTITGATANGSVTGEDGTGYNSFSLGDATILIEDDITNVSTGVV